MQRDTLITCWGNTEINRTIRQWLTHFYAQFTRVDSKDRAMQRRGQLPAMDISDRPCRAVWPMERVLEHSRKVSGSHFDPDLVEVFLREIRLHGT